MKRLFFIITSILLLSSCGFDDGSGSTTTYQLTATFQYTPAPTFRSDSTFINTTTPQGFGFDALNFYHQLDADNIWFDGGFLLSCLEMPESENTTGLPNTYRANVKYNKSFKENIYTVYYQNPDPVLMPEHAISFPLVANGTCTMAGCFVTNTVETAEFIKANFKLGDKMTLKATGWLNGAKTGEAEFTLAEYSAKKDSIVSAWTGFEMSKLGVVEHVDFEVSSTVEGTPAYFCMDNMVAEIKLTY